MRRAAIWAAAVGLAVLAVGLPVLLLGTPPVTATLSNAFSQSERTGLAAAQVSDLAESVRAFVIRGEGALPARVEGREGFESAAVSHLEDVRDVLRLARIVTGLIAVTLAAWIAWALSRKRFRDVGEALRYGALVGVVGVSIAIAFAIVDFDTFFTAFHGLFFADGTWTFPGDSLLIQLFPEPFWASLGGAWGVLAGLTMVGYWVIGTKLLDEGFDERA